MAIERGTTGVIQEAEQTAAKADEIYRRLEDLPIINPIKDDCDGAGMTPDEVANFFLTGEKPDESVLKARVLSPKSEEEQTVEWTFDEQIRYLDKGLEPGEKATREILSEIKSKVKTVWQAPAVKLRNLVTSS